MALIVFFKMMMVNRSNAIRDRETTRFAGIFIFSLTLGHLPLLYPFYIYFYFLSPLSSLFGFPRHLMIRYTIRGVELMTCFTGCLGWFQ
jgi:hypothetical protein